MEYPLYTLRPEEAARLIVLEPLRRVKPLAFEHKREMRLHPSHKSKPSNKDMQFWAKADHKRYWEAFKADELKEFPRVLEHSRLGVLIGPLLSNGEFCTACYKPELKKEWAGLYSRDEHDADIASLEHTRAILRENFILGQRHEGPYLDGLVYMRADNLLVAEMLRCENRLRMTWAILAKRKNKQPKAEVEHVWLPIGNDETAAMRLKHDGHTIRKIDREHGAHYEVMMK